MNRGGRTVRTVLGVVGNIGAVLLATVASWPALASASTLPPPKGLPSFYAVPNPLPGGPPGTLIKHQLVDVPGVEGTVYRVMYTSRNLQGHPVAVTGVVIVPTAPAPSGGYPVVSWGHGTNGMADICAPSLDPGNAVPLVNDLLARGWEVTASDYQGEGTPGLMPYLAGKIAARDTVDIVRAARRFRAAHASDQYVVWGHSEGGQTAMYGLEIGPGYARSLHLDGVVAGAPPSQFQYIYQFLQNSPYRYYLFMAAGGLHAAYGDRAPLREVLTPLAMSKLPVLKKGCAAEVASAIDSYQLSDLVNTDPFQVPDWRTVLQLNDPEDFTSPSPVPLLMIQGGDDEQIPVASTQLLENHLCSIGQKLERWVYPGQSHAGVIGPSMGDMIQWIADRFSGQPMPDPYVPTGEPDVQTESC